MKTEEKKGKHSDFHFNSYIIFFYSEMNDVLTPKNDSFDNVHVSFFSFFKCNIQYEEENSFNHTSIILSECVGFFSHWFIFFFLFSVLSNFVCVCIYIYIPRRPFDFFAFFKSEQNECWFLLSLLGVFRLYLFVWSRI